LLFASVANAETVRVNPSKTQQLQTILNGLQSGDTVLFERGTYRTAHALELKGAYDITIRGEGKVEIVLSDLDDPVFSVSDCQDIHITGLRARHHSPNQEYACEGAVVRVVDSKRVAVSNCELNGCGAAGVYASATQELVVCGNTIFNNTFAAVWVYDSSGIVHGNRMHKNAAELICGGTSDVTLSGNRIENNRGNDFNETDFSRKILRDASSRP
jgi:parallel beta-helix repeat protein